MAQDYKHDPTLFTENGQSLVFFLRPCAEKSLIRPMIEHGGGKVISKYVPEAIKLAVDGDFVTSTDYLSTKYILECVEQNKLLDREKFTMKKKNSKKFISEHAEELSDVSDDLSPSSSVLMEAKDRKGRNKYTADEDHAMLKYVVTEKRRSGLQGLQLYKDMEILKITNHTASSMNCRMRKNILPNINSYDIPQDWKKYLSAHSPFKGANTKAVDKSSLNKLSETLTRGKRHSPPLSSVKKAKQSKLDNSVEIESYSSEDDFDKKLTDCAKTSNCSTPTKKLVVDLSDSIVQLDSMGNVMKAEKNVQQEKEANRDKASDKSDEDLDSSLIRYSNVNISSDDEQTKKMTERSLKKTSTPMKTTEGETELKKFSPGKISPKKYLLDDFEKNKNERRGKRNSQNKESCVSYIMDVEDTPEVSDADAKITSDVEKLQRTLTRLGELYGLLDEEVFHLIRLHDGNMKETMRYIETGKSELTWKHEDDNDFEANLKKLNTIYGEKRVKLRAAFLEGI